MTREELIAFLRDEANECPLRSRVAEAFREAAAMLAADALRATEAEAERDRLLVAITEFVEIEEGDSGNIAYLYEVARNKEAIAAARARLAKGA